MSFVTATEAEEAEEAEEDVAEMITVPVVLNEKEYTLDIVRSNTLEVCILLIVLIPIIKQDIADTFTWCLS